MSGLRSSNQGGVLSVKLGVGDEGIDEQALVASCEEGLEFWREVRRKIKLEMGYELEEAKGRFERLREEAEKARDQLARLEARASVAGQVLMALEREVQEYQEARSGEV